MLIIYVSGFEPGLFRPVVPMIALYEGQLLMNKHEEVLVSNTPSLIIETNTPSAYS